MYDTRASQWYAERKDFQLVSTAAELARYLDNVEQRGAGWDYHADAPCHISTSKTSFVFKDAVGGGIDMHCFAGCVDTGSSYTTFVDIVEMALKVRINMRYKNGNLRWERKWKSYRELLMESEQVENLTYRSRNVTITATPDEFTLRDLLHTDVWIPTRITESGARIPLEFDWRGTRYGFAQSNKDIRLAQEGGGVIQRGERQVTLLGWVDARKAHEKGKERGGNAVGLVLSGDKSTPARTDVGVLDFDLKQDTTDNLEWRNSVYEYMFKAGCPIIPSRSGAGFHALWRQIPSEERMWDDRNAVARLVPDKREGAGIDFYPAGSRRLINIVLQNITPELLDKTIPRMEFQEFETALRSKEEMLQQRLDVQVEALEQKLNSCWAHGDPLPCATCKESEVIGHCTYCSRNDMVLLDERCKDRSKCWGHIYSMFQDAKAAQDAEDREADKAYLQSCKDLGVLEEAKEAYHRRGNQDTAGTAQRGDNHPAHIR